MQLWLQNTACFVIFCSRAPLAPEGRTSLKYYQGASGTVYRAVYDPSLALSGREDVDDDDLGLSVVRSTCTVAVKKMKVLLSLRY